MPEAAKENGCNHALTVKDFIVFDTEDPLAHFRKRFILPERGVYLDGNSLGCLPKATRPALQQAVEQQWGIDLIQSWNKHDWIDLPQRIGSKLATILKAGPGEIVCCDSTSLNVFKTVSAALDLRPDRHIIISERSNFPTDLYMLEGLIGVRGGKHELVLIDDPQDLLTGGIDLSIVAVVLLTHVSYRSGRMLPMRDITSVVHTGGALMVWDLAHSAGAVPVDLTDASADFAVGCGYKFLNGGPGAPAFLYVAQRHQEAAKNPLSGWFGHQNAFAFDHSYMPARGVDRFLCGTPSVLASIALEVGLDVMIEADQQELRQKSMALGSLFLQLVDQECGEHEFKLFSPADAKDRGSQINLCHPEGYAIIQALIARGIVGDFRSPNILRFGFTPLYTSYQDIWVSIQNLKAVMQDREWDCEKFKAISKVT